MKGERTVAAVALVLLGALAAIGCRSGDRNPTAMEKPSNAPNEGMRGISLRNINIGDTAWVLHADTASIFRQKKRVIAERVVIDFFEEQGHVSRLTAKQGVLHQATDDLEARGDVQVATDDGALLTTEILFWDHQKAKIHTDEYVVITRGEDVLTGFGLEADPGLDRVDIKREVKGTVRGDPEELLGEGDEETSRSRDGMRP